jgi:peroxin-6
LENGSEVTNGSLPDADGKDKGKSGVSTSRTNSGSVPTASRAKGRAMMTTASKGKNKSVVSEGDSDSSFDGYRPSSRNGSVHSPTYDVGEEADDDGLEDGNDYVVRTDHLQKTNDADVH